MWNFNKVGRVVEETSLHRGLTARMTKVWPWKRKQLSGSSKYLVTITNPQGVEVYNNYHTHTALFSHIVTKYLQDVAPLESYIEGLEVRAFSMATALETYLEPNLPDGVHLVMVPLNKKVSDEFWKTKSLQISSDPEDTRIDGYVTNVTGYDGVLEDLIADSYARYPGRYFLVVIKDGFAQSTESLI